MYTTYKRICIVFCMCFTTYGFSQIFSTKKIINPEPGVVRMIRSADLDGDGDIDIALAANNFISWYENIDGQGNFSAPIAIQEGMGQSFNIALAQIDDNSTVDIVVSFFDEGILAWYPNTGIGFGNMQLIANGFLGARGVTTKDLDNDGDNDVVFGISNFSGLYWFENLDGEGNFSAAIPIDANISNARTQAVEDIDGDGDMDVLTNSSGVVSVSWFENLDGLGTFSDRITIEDDGGYENFMYLFDIDGDSDFDILSEKGNGIIWRENTDGQGNFADFIIIDNVIENPSDAIAVDLDNDNDNDVLVTWSTGNRVGWYENLDGQGSFGAQQIIDPDFKSPRTVHAADLDGDGDFDVLTAALEPGMNGNGERELVWYENLTVLSHNALQNKLIHIAPNPVKDTLIVKSEIPIQSITFYTTLGQEIKTIQNPKKTVAVSFLTSGLYYLQIQTTKGSLVKKVLKE